MNINFETREEVNVFADDGETRHTLTVLQCVRTHNTGFNILVKLPSTLASPQEITDLRSQTEAQAAIMRQMSDEIAEWKKRFDALLFSKGGAA